MQVFLHFGHLELWVGRHAIPRTPHLCSFQRCTTWLFLHELWLFVFFACPQQIFLAILLRGALCMRMIGSSHRHTHVLQSDLESKKKPKQHMQFELSKVNQMVQIFFMNCSIPTKYQDPVQLCPHQQEYSYLVKFTYFFERISSVTPILIGAQHILKPHQWLVSHCDSFTSPEDLRLTDYRFLRSIKVVIGSTGDKTLTCLSWRLCGRSILCIIHCTVYLILSVCWIWKARNNSSWKAIWH